MVSRWLSRVYSYYDDQVEEERKKISRRLKLMHFFVNVRDDDDGKNKQFA